jgi:SpoVK/Ycf46/Vps4 family AAA+-type ATPase
MDIGLMDVEFDLKHGTHTLIEKEYVQFTDDDGFVDSGHWKLSDKAKKELLSEYKNKEQFKKNMLSFNKIKDKQMFFNAKETVEIEKLTSLLQETNFRKIQDHLGDKSMRKGIACLFSGSPGTGKTETVYQIARQTKSKIMLVDISGTKSCWYGDSEKRIKELFDIYRLAVENSKIAPILLFNEADAIIGKRRINNDNNNHSVDQTENTIQNIILQEMENLDGILIATTNLAQNMDNAFERRFLYKIKFEKPGQEGRANIWSSLLPDLPENWIAELSKRFELSGGQIENIARKTEVDGILLGGKLSLDTLIQYCKDETQNSFNASARIGFT